MLTIWANTERLKCNRALPCDTCFGRQKASSCVYAANATRHKPAPPSSRAMKDRLNRLEHLVSSFINKDTAIPITPYSESSNSSQDLSGAPAQQPARRHSPASSNLSKDYQSELLTPESPHLQETDDGQVNYIDRSHWMSILDDIKEVREHIDGTSRSTMQEPAQPEFKEGSSDASYLFSSSQTPTLGDILATLPSRSICDMILSSYFNSTFMVLGKQSILTL